MYLTHAQITNYKCIEDSGVIEFDPKVTVLVGQNEAGKTAVLEALEKTNSINERKFHFEDDYPRQKVVEYRKRHKENPETVVTHFYKFSPSEAELITKEYGFNAAELVIRFKDDYKGGFEIFAEISEEPALVELKTRAMSITSDLPNDLISSKSIREFISNLAGGLEPELEDFRDELIERFQPEKRVGNLLLREIIGKYSSIPNFFYFDDYFLLPSKINLADLQQKSKRQGPALSESDETVLSLLKMAGVTIDELLEIDSYESIKSRLEGFSNAITDKVFKYWKQNEGLQVEFDIKGDPKDSSPFNNGLNLYIRIKNLRHRVSVPFRQRSKGFIWFFSFIIWFDSVKEKNPDGDVILLLDEPGLNLHGLAQSDLLRYIDDLSLRHQIIYTTHSPFMIQNDRLHQARVVEDKGEKGTIMSQNLGGTNAQSIFPLQAALGYSIAQNLFIRKRNLLVEGPADLIYLRFVSNLVETSGRSGIRGDLAIVPTGGLDKVATFVALLNGNDLELVVVHDFDGSPDQRMQSLVNEKIIKDKRVISYANFREPQSPLRPSDIEDLFEVEEYLSFFNSAFAEKLPKAFEISELPKGDRIVLRISKLLEIKGVLIRPSGGFNHYTVANQLLISKTVPLSGATMNRFERLFNEVNKLFSA